MTMRNENARRARWTMLLIPGILLLGGGILIAFMVDMYTIRTQRHTRATSAVDELEHILLSTELRVYQGPKQRFAMEVPPNWMEYHPSASDSPFDVVFRSANGFEFAVIATDVGPKSLQTLRREIGAIERRLAVTMNIESTTFQGLPAIKRRIVLHYTTLIIYDFLYDGIAHEVQLSMPHRYENEAEPVLLPVLLEGYHPL